MEVDPAEPRHDLTPDADADELLRAAADGLAAITRESGGDAGGRLAAVRVEFTGHSGADAELRRRQASGELAAAVRAAANHHAGVWVEAVRVRTTPPPSKEPADPDGPLAVLAELLEETAADPAAAADLADAVLGDLRREFARKIPDPDDRPDLADPDRLRSLLADAGRLAVSRLTGA